MTRDLLEQVEAEARETPRGNLLATLAWLAGQEVEIEEAELNGAARRAVLLLAAGGDPERPLELDGRAVTALAADLDAPERRVALQRGVAVLLEETAGLPRVQNHVRQLLADGTLAWHAFAGGLLVQALDA